MEGFTKFENEKPHALTDVEVMYAGRIIKTQWGVENSIGGVIVTAWALDPSGQVMPMWWRYPIPE